MKVQKSIPACRMPAYKSMLHTAIMQRFQSEQVQKIQNRGTMEVQKYVTCWHAELHVACQHAELHVACQHAELHVACWHAKLHVACQHAELHAACQHAELHAAWQHAELHAAWQHVELHAACQLLKTACHIPGIENCMLQCESVKL